MGYTHRWWFKNRLAPKDIENGEEKFAKVAEIVKVCLKKVTDKGIKIAGGSGEGEPTINAKCVCFNGLDDEAYETFHIAIDRDEFDFTKTNRNPYDLLVCLALLALKEVFGEDFNYSSDGITREDYENRDKNEYWKKIGFVPESPEKEWLDAYEVWDEVKTEMGL